MLTKLSAPPHPWGAVLRPWLALTELPPQPAVPFRTPLFFRAFLNTLFSDRLLHKGELLPRAMSFPSSRSGSQPC